MEYRDLQWRDALISRDLICLRMVFNASIQGPLGTAGTQGEKAVFGRANGQHGVNQFGFIKTED